jgi:ATP-dependent DNA ligase LigD phosphoesterase module/ATP-dependent DNA ligase LigD polymerase module
MTEKLKEYNSKRNFEKTGEPRGIDVGEALKDTPEEGLRFAVQHHAARKDHYDLRLEWNGVLLSWAVPKGPSYNPKDKRLAVKVEDHPLDYRSFEGTIPKGEYGGGTVMLWDEGFWEPQNDVDEGLSAGSLKFVLKGRRLKGKWVLIRLKAKEGEKKDNWIFLKEKDEYAQDDEGISEFDTSIKTGRTMEEIGRGGDEKFIKNPISHADVQLAKLVNTVPEGQDWLFEVKYDGYRILAYLERNSARLITRNGNDYTGKFQSIADSLIEWANGRPMILDGEMVVTDPQGRTDFQALQSYLKNRGGKNLVYIVFDLLALDGVDLRGRPLIERKETLENLLKTSPDNIYFSKHVRGNGKESFKAACELNLEGIVGKKADSVYSGTRNGDWIKLKCDKRQEFVIGGYTLSDKKAGGVSSLLLGFYQENELIYAGRAGTGFSMREMRELESKFETLIRETSPFKQVPAPKKNEKVFWLEPELVAEIKFTEWTEDNLLRQASFKGLRTDKDPKDIKIESTGDEMQTGENTKAEQPSETLAKAPTKATGNSIIIEGVKISNPDKIIFEDPVIKKVEVVQYYAAVAERMMPYVGNRILSIVRCPKGISSSCFFKKHPGPGGQGTVTLPIETGSGETEDYFYIENMTGLVYEAQMGTLEFHIWGSRADNLEKPDMMVFDLDPDEGMELEQVRQGVRDLKSILDQLSLISYLKTSGGKGYHIVVPFSPSADWNSFHDFAKRIAEVMEQKWPDRYTSNIRKDKRKNKIFIDWIRNARGATSIAPYSIRAKKGAPVSMPISWDELDTVSPNGIGMKDALERIKGSDPWENFYKVDQRLK